MTNGEKDYKLLADFFPAPGPKPRKKFKKFPAPSFADGLDELADALEREVIARGEDPEA